MAAAHKTRQSGRPSACEEKEVRRISEVRDAIPRVSTLVGYSPERPLEERDPSEDVTAVAAYAQILEGLPAPALPREQDAVVADRTVIERYRKADGGETTRLTKEAIDELKRKLRAAEQREESGIRGQFDRSGDDPLADLEIDVETPVTLSPASRSVVDEAAIDEASLGSLPEIEVALAPHSESNFYGGFDEENPDGVFVATYASRPIGAPLVLRIVLPAGYVLRATAVVEFTRPPEAATEGAPAGLGVKLCGLDVRARRLITAFCRYRPPYFYVG